jgi:hypothetical protein
MHHVVQRIGFRLSRGVVSLFVIIALLIAAAFWIGPLRPQPPELRLVALSGDGRFHEYVGIPSAWADTLSPASEAIARFPLLLAVHNAGPTAAQPTQLSLSLPARYRVATTRGPLEYRTSMGNPLARYDLPMNAARIEPRARPKFIAGIDTLWLEPIVPSLYCTALADSVPEFIAAPPHDPNALSRVRIFYSFTGDNIRQRQTGLLTVQVDPNLVKSTPTPTLPVFPTEIVKPEAPAPELGALTFVGSRLSGCGDPSQPIELHTALWETLDGGRFFVLYHGGAPRKHLYDLNRDSIIELEMWDSDADGKFEARRAARIRIPGFLMPFPKPRPDSAAVAAAVAAVDTMPLDSAWLRTFHNLDAGPLRFVPRRAPPPPRAQPPGPRAQPETPRPGAPIVAEPVDSAALRIFNTEEAGPLRFQRAMQGDTVRPRPRPRPQRPRLLGVPYNPQPRPDTIR